MSSRLASQTQTACDANRSANSVCQLLRRLWDGPGLRVGPARPTIFSSAVRRLPLCQPALGAKVALFYFNRGSAFVHKRQYDLATRDFDEAIRLDPKFAAAYNMRGLVYSHKHDCDRAIADFGETIRLDPKFAAAYHNRGQA